MKRRSIFLILFLAALILPSCTSGSPPAAEPAAVNGTAEPTARPTADPDSPAVQDALQYAEDMGVSPEEALNRMEVQQALGESGLESALMANEADTFAGLWLQHEPAYRVVVAFTRDGEQTIYLPRQAPTEVYLDAEVGGRLSVDENGCLRLEDERSDEQRLILWHAGHTLRFGDGIEVLNDSGEVIARVGEALHGGGGYLDSRAPAIPGMPIAACPGPYILLGMLSPLSAQETGNLQQLRISNIGETSIQELTVVFPGTTTTGMRVNFESVDSGQTTEYQMIPGGVYRYAAYEYTVGEETVFQPVIDWLGEKPLPGTQFTYQIVLDETKVRSNQIHLVEVLTDS